MTILIVNTFYYPDMIGGAEHSVKLLAEGLVRAGHTVVVLCENTKRTSEPYQVENINGVIVYRDSDPIMQGRKLIKRLIRGCRELYNTHSKKVCKKLIDSYSFDIVHFNNVHYLSCQVWKYFNSKNIPNIFTARDYWMMNHSCHYTIHCSLFQWLYRKYYQFWSNRKYIDILTAPSNVTLNIFKKEKFFKNVYSIRVVNCIDLDMQETHKIIDSRKGNSESFVKFLYVGALGEYKGIINLLKAFHSIQNQKICLTICGSGNEEPLVRQYCEMDQRIEYLGQLGSEELKQVYMSHDVLVAPSVWDEPFGRIVIEANQYGLPVIGSDRGGIKEILEFTKTGKIFPATDIEALAKTCMEFADREVIKSYYPRILQTIGEYSLERQIENYLDVYRKAIEIRKNKTVEKKKKG